jgi:hypothetical protein
MEELIIEGILKMKQSKICTLETYILLTNAINLREGYPIKLANGYQAKSYLPEPEAAKHPLKNLYFIVKDEVTSQFIPSAEFTELTEDWHREPTTWQKAKNLIGL